AQSLSRSKRMWLNTTTADDDGLYQSHQWKVLERDTTLLPDEKIVLAWTVAAPKTLRPLSPSGSAIMSPSNWGSGRSLTAPQGTTGRFPTSRSLRPSTRLLGRTTWSASMPMLRTGNPSSTNGPACTATGLQCSPPPVTQSPGTCAPRRGQRSLMSSLCGPSLTERSDTTATSN